jgi:hypothetical protein
MAMNDPIVNEIRKFRDEHARKLNYDIKAICSDYRKKHMDYAEKLAKLRTKKQSATKRHNHPLKCR